MYFSQVLVHSTGKILLTGIPTCNLLIDTCELGRFWYILQVKLSLQIIPTGDLVIPTCDLGLFLDFLQV